MVTVSLAQKATISDEAQLFLSKIPMVPFPSLLAPYVTSPRRAITLRNDMSAKTRSIEEDLIARHDLTLKDTTIASVPVTIICPPHIAPDHKDRILINCFGGGFIMGSSHERAALLMAAEMHITVYSIAYSKSPESRYPVARDEVLSVYRELLKTQDPRNILAMGSSAGAQILVSALLLARDENLPMPRTIYLCTPALDLTGAGDSMVSNANDRDVMPASLLSSMVRQNYQPFPVAGKEFDTKEPLYSPIYAEYNNAWPSTVISVGTRDLCLSSGVRMFWKLRERGVRVELLVGEGMWHGFNWEEKLSEARVMRRAVREFLCRETDPNRQTGLPILP